MLCQPPSASSDADRSVSQRTRMSGKPPPTRLSQTQHFCRQQCLLRLFPQSFGAGCLCRGFDSGHAHGPDVILGRDDMVGIFPPVPEWRVCDAIRQG